MRTVRAGYHVVTHRFPRYVEQRATLVESAIVTKDSIGKVRVAHHDRGPGTDPYLHELTAGGGQRGQECQRVSQQRHRMTDRPDRTRGQWDL